MMSPAMTANLWKDKESDPVRKAAFAKMCGDSGGGSLVCCRAIPEVNIDWGGAGQGHKECTSDGNNVTGWR